MMLGTLMRRAAWVLAATAGVLAGAAAPRPAVLVYPQYPMVSHQPVSFVRSLMIGDVKAAEAVSTPEPTQTPINPAIRVLWNFTTADNVDEWKESSDGTERAAGMSTGAFKLQKTTKFQRAVMFSLINPQPNGAGFVGFYVDGERNLSQYKTINITCRAQGQGHHYKIYMKAKNGPPLQGGSYESYFELPDNKFTTVSVPLSSFKFYYRGRLIDDAPALDASAITRFGLQIFGGVYDDHVQQRGASALEIDSITVGP